MMISVIVPVYKVEPYLRRCVDSVLNQTYTDLELILVDDGSPDNCGAICDEYAAADSRVRVIHKDNGGVSSARNMGLDAARGEFVAFLDSDDWYHPQALELWHRAAEEFGVDGVTAASLWTPTDEMGMETADYASVEKHFYSGAEIRKDMYRLAFSGGVVKDTLTCGLYGMYRRACYEGIHFDEGIACGEDLVVLFRVNLAAKAVVHLDLDLYYYYIGNQSAMRSGLNKNKLTLLDALLGILDALAGVPEQAQRVYYRYLYTYLDFDLQVNSQGAPELVEAMEGHRKKLKKSRRGCRYLSALEGLAFGLCVLGIPGYRKFFGKVAPEMEQKLRTFVVR